MYFRLLILGENFPMGREGETELMGWYKTVWVEAANQDEARAKSLDVIRSSPSMAGALQGSGATVTWEEIEAVKASEVPDQERGFSFFHMED